MKYYLISYRCEQHKYGTVSYSYQCVRDVPRWIEDVQKYTDETYILLNVLEISEAEYLKFDGSLAGM